MGKKHASQYANFGSLHRLGTQTLNGYKANMFNGHTIAI